MKLEKKHLAPYLPYDIKGFVKLTKSIFTIRGFNDRNEITTFGNYGISDFDGIELVLFPLSDLLNEVEINGKFIIPINSDVLRHVAKFPFDFNDLQFEKYYIVQKLFELKFDVFGLIDAGLAKPVTKEFNPYK